MIDYTSKQHAINSEYKTNEHVAPGTQIHYVPGLIDKLERDHVELLKLLQKSAQAFDQEKYKKTVKRLKKFKLIFMQHLILENLKLYIYLKHSFVNNSDLQDQIKDFRREMRKISKYVLVFLDKYEGIIKDKQLRKSFEKDLKSVYLTLKKRLKREEQELYPLYQDSF